MERCIIYRLNHGGGFFSTFFFICKAFLTSIYSRVPFYIENESWPYTYEKGWHDYMRTLESPPLMHSVLNVGHMRRYVTHNTQSKEREFTLRDYKYACHEIFKLNPDLRERVNAIVRSINEPYIAIFVRRGDKLNEEASFIHMRDILKSIPHTNETRFFVQTDDYTVIEELQELHPHERIHFTVPSYKRGQYLMALHKDMDNGRNPHISSIVPLAEQTKERIKEETEEMLVGLSVCYLAPQCWTDCTSNVGRFLKLMSIDTVHFYPVDNKIDLNVVHCPSVNFPV